MVDRRLVVVNSLHLVLFYAYCVLMRGSSLCYLSVALTLVLYQIIPLLIDLPLPSFSPISDTHPYSNEYNNNSYDNDDGYRILIDLQLIDFNIIASFWEGWTFPFNITTIVLALYSLAFVFHL